MNDDEIEKQEEKGELKLWHWCLFGFTLVGVLYLVIAFLLDQ